MIATQCTEVKASAMGAVWAMNVPVRCQRTVRCVSASSAGGGSSSSVEFSSRVTHTRSGPAVKRPLRGDLVWRWMCLCVAGELHGVLFQLPVLALARPRQTSPGL